MLLMSRVLAKDLVTLGWRLECGLVVVVGMEMDRRVLFCRVYRCDRGSHSDSRTVVVVGCSEVGVEGLVGFPDVEPSLDVGS